MIIINTWSSMCLRRKRKMPLLLLPPSLHLSRCHLWPRPLPCWLTPRPRQPLPLPIQSQSQKGRMMGKISWQNYR